MAEDQKTEARKEGRWPWIWPAALLVALLLIAWFVLPLGRSGPRPSQEADARSWIELLESGAKVYQLDRGAFPPGDGSGSAVLAKCLRTQGTNKHAPLRIEKKHLDRDGNVLNPVGESKIIYYRSPGTHNPKSFDLWCEDAKGRADGINNWEK
jgi:hypothetical protein